ncbi:MAG: helix-turn-helix transcriptional regulator [Campylobacterales bacterium]
MHGYDEPVYLISVVASMLCVHPQTLRQYEREGIISPSRTEGKMRLYSQRDIDKIKFILKLTRELGVNLAGVDIIMRMREELDAAYGEVERLRKIIAQANLHGSVPKGKEIVPKSQRTWQIVMVEE